MTALLTTHVRLAADLLRQGKLVAFATETVYGLGGNAFNERTVAGIFEAKQRPHFDPLIVHLATVDDLAIVARQVPDVARRLMDCFWPGPLTLVLPKQPVIPDLVTAGLPDVAVRVPAHALARELIHLSGVPIAAPSANLFGRISPTTAEHVIDQLGERIDAVLDGGPCQVGVESTVLKCNADGSVRLLRPGGLTIEQIEAEIGRLDGSEMTVLDQHVPQPAPGMLAQHYAPRKPLMLITDWKSAPRGADIGVLTLSPLSDQGEYGLVEVLSLSGSLTEAAANFFAAMRRLDAANVNMILAQRFPDIGLGRALNDRLQRAAGQGVRH